MRWIARAGASPYGPPLAALLVAPALGTGLVIDDYLLRDRLQGLRWRGLLDAFALATDANFTAMRARGDLPWWSAPELRMSFFRPLAALTHALDFAWLPPWAMHVESMLWLAALNVAVWAWYRRLYGREHGLATALYVIAPGHAFAASWLANRNGVLAALFAVLALHAFDLARANARSTWPAAGLLALSLLAGEIGLGGTGLLLAHALCLDRGAGRVRALAPALIVTLAWLGVRALLGYGVQASSLYVDPLREPWRFAVGAVEHLPLLAFGQLGLPGITVDLFLSRRAAQLAAVLALAALCLTLPRARALLRSDARARFAALGALLALLPVGATVIHDRLLIVADIAGAGLLAQLLTARPTPFARLWCGTRVLLSILLALAYAASLQEHIEHGERAFVGIPGTAARSVVFVNAPCAFYPIQLRRLRMHEGGPVPRSVHTLAAGLQAITVERRDARTLRVSAAGGLLQPRDSEHSPAFSRVNLAQILDHFPRAAWDYRAGDRIALGELTLQIVSAKDGYPEQVDFAFASELTNLEIFAWQPGGYRPLALPRDGEVVHLGVASDHRPR